jgi:hypothetical protein
MNLRASSDPAVAFYSGGVDHRGRTLDDILAWDDADLESVHDYIQWVFPTRQPSGVNRHAPLVTPITVESFTADTRLRARLRRAFERMLRFYGLRQTSEGIDPDPARFAARARIWLHRGNHNHLRLTRIMESVATLGLPDEARALQRCLLDRVAPTSGHVSPATLEFWKRSVR